MAKESIAVLHLASLRAERLKMIDNHFSERARLQGKEK